MITQRIKNWLRRFIGWWRSSPVEYRHDSGALSSIRPPEGVSRSTLEGKTPQVNTTNTTGTTGAASTTPSLSTIEEQPAYAAPAPSPAKQDSPQPPLSPPTVTSTPTPQQRLEFLRYLVKQGIVNEGNDE
jgi:hypothetical protein